MPLAITTIRKSAHGFLLLSYMGMVLRLAVLWAASVSTAINMFIIVLHHRI